MVVNHLTRWALYLHQFGFLIECRRTVDHQNANALSRFSLGEDELFDEEDSAGLVMLTLFEQFQLLLFK